MRQAGAARVWAERPWPRTSSRCRVGAIRGEAAARSETAWNTTRERSTSSGSSPSSTISRVLKVTWSV